MTDQLSRVEQDRQRIVEARARGTGAKFWVYTKLSGPGWLQSAITLGSGSLAGSLYLGVLAGHGLMWLQPLAMILGVIMLSAIGYVALSTGDRPLAAINRHVNPVLGWGWAIATLMANLVWCMPQFAIGTEAIRQNLASNLFGPEVMDVGTSKVIVVAILFFTAGVVVWFYDSGAWGVKLFEGLLKVMVGVIIVCFFGVVVKMSTGSAELAWSEILAGFVPNLNLLYDPSPAFHDALAATGEYSEFWSGLIVADQQKVMITAAATAVGINMTFLLPYSMLRRGWDRDFRGLAVFDLSTGLVVPFVLATGCIIIASASQFHAQPSPGFLGEFNEQGALIKPSPAISANFASLADSRIKQEIGAEGFQALDESAVRQRRNELPVADRTLAAMLVKRNAFDLADSLRPLTGQGVSQYVFGVGVVGMAISSIIILMLINGFVVCEMLGLPSKGAAHRLGSLLAGVSGAAGPFLWGNAQAQFWLAVPTSMFGMVLLPIAYFTFFLMMNSRSLLGDDLPRGGKRVAWNLLMGAAALLAAFGSYWSIRTSAYPLAGTLGLGGFITLASIVHFVRRKESNKPS
jgi:Mn2+/Fe2+ NRAMP family transporter